MVIKLILLLEVFLYVLYVLSILTSLKKTQHIEDLRLKMLFYRCAHMPTILVTDLEIHIVNIILTTKWEAKHKEHTIQYLILIIFYRK